MPAAEASSLLLVQAYEYGLRTEPATREALLCHNPLGAIAVPPLPGPLEPIVALGSVFSRRRQPPLRQMRATGITADLPVAGQRPTAGTP